MRSAVSPEFQSHGNRIGIKLFFALLLITNFCGPNLVQIRSVFSHKRHLDSYIEFITLVKVGTKK